MYTKHSAVREIPAERSVLPWTNDRNWYADTQATLIVTSDDDIHAQMSDSHTVMRTRDGGRTWDNLQVTKSINSVLYDGTFPRSRAKGWDVAGITVKRSGKDMGATRTD